MAETYYSEEHEWITVDGETGTVGITGFAQEQLGDIVFVEVIKENEDVAKDEEVAVVSTEDPFLFARACYHLGNRHVPLQIGEGWLRIQRDHVLENMVQSLGLLVSHQLAPFEPESGAYSGQTNHSHSHSHKTEV